MQLQVSRCHIYCRQGIQIKDDLRLNTLIFTFFHVDSCRRHRKSLSKGQSIFFECLHLVSVHPVNDSTLHFFFLTQ